MSGWIGVYTQKGLNLLAKLTEGSTLQITRAVTGTGVVDVESLDKQTAISGQKQELSFQTPTYPETGMCKLPMFVTNDGVATEYTAHQIGLYATDPDEGAILYFIAQSTTGTDIPPESDITGYTATWTFYFKYGQADDVTVNVDPTNAVTKDMLEEVRVIAKQGVSQSKSGNPVVVENTANVPFAGLSIYGKSTQNGTPTPDAPIDIVSIAESGSVTVSVYEEDTTVDPGQTVTVSVTNGLPGIPVSSGGNYTDTTGQQWICDEIDLVRGVYVQRIGVIAAYNGESVTSQYMSTTGGLSNGAEIIYVLATPIETPLSIDAMTANNPITTVLNNAGAEMFVDCIRDVNENAFRLAIEANQEHTHQIDDVIGLPAVLDTKAPAYTWGTDDLTAGTTELPTGTLHFVYQ